MSTTRISQSATLIAVLALIGSMASLCVGTSFAKSLFSAVGAQGTTALRVGFSALILLAVWRPWRLPLSARHARVIALYGASLGATNLLFYMALRSIPLGLCIAIEFMGPLTVAVLSSRRAIDFLWIAFAVVGLLMLLPLGDAATHLDPVGLGYAMAAGVGWALYIVFGQMAGSAHGGQATSLGLTMAAIVVFPFGLAHAGMDLFTPSLLLSGLAVGLLSSAIPYSLEMVSLKRLPRKTFGILLSMEPAMGALAGLVFLHEQLTMVQWLAIGSIIAASIGCTVTARGKRNVADEGVPA
ncbi:DMT family transporter [Cupriavidus plantarum]|nr:DMT family transporter [Cupriavidus plantarum]RLK39005.1 inner membrane transporter RhtA [Cupriavidus plantarum]CAG2135934.1 Threonine/homoserine exporter RhtA [Cupriavidus plantarum]SMR84664.1 inner membrane transporter RhtA [Cupriavidus plantarum]